MPHSPVRVSCRLGRARTDLPSPGVDFESLKVTLEEAFRIGSFRGTQNPPNIDLKVTSAYASSAELAANMSTTHLNLLQSLRSLIGHQSTSTLNRKIGLLMADRFASYPRAYGYMIDGSIRPNDPHAREGAVVFLHPIIQDRITEGPEAVRREFSFTSVHELGHVFNLWHDDNEPNFMASSGALAYPSSAHKFIDDHRQYLRINDPRFVQYLRPGDSPWGQRPPGFPADGSVENSKKLLRSSKSGLKLNIRAKPDSFYFMEPVELDITLSCSRGMSVRVPDMLDPGYENFVIWIQKPNGEKVRYRPIKRFCAHTNTIEVTGGKPFHRDISIFAQKGGYSFHEAGNYEIYATFDLASTTLISNRVEVEVREADTSRECTLLLDTVGRSRILELLYFREGTLPARDRTIIQNIKRRLPESHFAASLDYAVARGLACHLAGLSRPRAASIQECCDELNRVSQLAELSVHRRRRAIEVAEQTKAL